MFVLTTWASRCVPQGRKWKGFSNTFGSDSINVDRHDTNKETNLNRRRLASVIRFVHERREVPGAPTAVHKVHQESEEHDEYAGQKCKAGYREDVSR